MSFSLHPSVYTWVGVLSMLRFFVVKSIQIYYKLEKTYINILFTLSRFVPIME